jgi:hypothetical protein
MRYGYLKLSRKLFDGADPFWKEERVFSRFEAWIDLLQRAAWKSGRYATAHRLDQLERGEFVASLRFLGERWGWDKMRVQRYLAGLEKAGHLTRQREGQHGAVYLIVKYAAYQSERATAETADETPDETPVRQQRDSGETKEKKGNTATAAASSARVKDSQRPTLAEALGSALTDRLEGVLLERATDDVAREHFRTVYAIACGIEPPHLTHAQLAEVVAEYLDKAMTPTLALFRGFLRTAKERADRPPPEPARPAAGAGMRPGSPTGRSTAPADRAARAGANALAAALAMNGRTGSSTATEPLEDPT